MVDLLIKTRLIDSRYRVANSRFMAYAVGLVIQSILILINFILMCVSYKIGIDTRPFSYFINGLMWGLLIMMLLVNKFIEKAVKKENKYQKEVINKLIDLKTNDSSDTETLEEIKNILK